MKTVLLVEDNTDNTLLIEDVFAFEGVAARLISVTSAEEALEVAMRTPPDLVLMDIGLPGMCGLEATRQLRANPATRRVPIWAVTARALKEDEEAARSAGCDFYITKPFDQEDLGYMVKFVVASTPPELYIDDADRWSP
ncbi:MAG: response regulator [Planctomycetaceae bacterium]|jgi:two-component system cell cycle response regulator DivK|uniref:Polar-differentiation response regulator DivK n=1 Tax=Lacipirellula limnantheis TaxID=2528024 RepID=A0A517U4F5_9BACT|nr:response regulator [Lacipirellula limnantheis]MBL9162118.1 response regulator [Planctomycetaceae bacterium]QDT75475.1 Polar-differentiation response regulator DivK [Lacipirellula limnantheis]